MPKLANGGGGFSSSFDWGTVGSDAAAGTAILPGWGTAIGAGIGLLSSYFGGKSDNVDPEIAAIEARSKRLGDTGTGLTEQGRDATSKALDYFAKLTSGNPADVLSATAPDRARVIDQYDAARKAITTTAPRGGGQASAMGALKSQEASDIATLPAKARTDAAGQLAAVGSATTSQGLSAEQASTQALASVLYPILQQGQTQRESTVATYSGIAQMLAELLFKSKAA